MPDLCARCGQPESIALWEIKHSTRTYDSDPNPLVLGLQLLLLPFGIHADDAKREHYRIPVPVCAACLRLMRLHHSISLALQLSGLVVTGLVSGRYCYKIVPNSEYFEPFIWIVVGLLGGLSGWLAGLVVAEILGFFLRVKMVSFDGLHFRFRNQAFHRAFALLNPNWVKP